MQGTAIEQLETAADLLASVDFHDLPDAVVLEWSERILRSQRKLDGTLNAALQVIEARDVTVSERGYTTRTWLVDDHQLAPADAARRIRVARSAPARPAIADALRAGDVTVDQASVVVGFLLKLPLPETRDLAEKELLDLCRWADPSYLAKGLRELADKLCLNETAEERALRRRQGRYLHLTDTINEMVRIDGMVPRAEGSILRKALYPLALHAGEGDERTSQQRNADALIELAVLSMKSGQLPETAGEPTQMFVMTDFGDLRRRLEAGESARSTLNGEPITPNTVRMLACDAGIIPAVMNGPSEILDLGRTTRTWSRAQRKAAKLRANNTCEAPRCRAAIERCDLHHQDYWSQGGRTDLEKAIYLCAFHHWLEHHTNWHITRNKHGSVEIRRT